MTDISEDSVSLDLSDIEKYMPYSGGDFNISVATNCDEWDFRFQDEWLEVSALTDYDYETNNYNVSDGTGKWDYALPMEHADKEYGNAGMAVLNPMSFIMTNFYIEPKPYDWFCINPDDQACLWGDELSMDKTIFDPCPAGYTVPAASAWTAGETFEAGNFGITVSGLFYPFTGYRITYSGNHDGSDEFGRYWTRSMYSEEGAEGRSIYMQASASGMELPFEGRAMSMAVRCVKIQ